MDPDSEIQEVSTTGFESLLIDKCLSKTVSSKYCYSLRSYLDSSLPPQVQEIVEEADCNALFYNNLSPLFLELRQRIKAQRYFENEPVEKIVFKYTLLYGSLRTLQSFKESMVTQKSKPLRQNIKEYLAVKLNAQSRRTLSIQRDIQEADCFNKFAQKYQVAPLVIGKIKVELSYIEFKEIPQLKQFLLWVVTQLGRRAQEEKARERSRRKEIKLESEQSTLSYETCLNKEKEHGVIILIAMYLKAGLYFGQWIKISQRDRDNKLSGTFFKHMSQHNGIHIIKRAIDDAPLSQIHYQQKLIESMFFVKRDP